MKNIYFILLFLLFILFINACALNQNQKSVSGSAVQQQEVQQAVVGIEKGQIPPDFTIATIDNKQYKLRLKVFIQNMPIKLHF